MVFFARFLALACLVAIAVADPAAPPPGNYAYLRVRGRGKQLYACNAASKAWEFDVAWADLFYPSDKNYTRRIGVHYFLQFPDANGGRPSWSLFRSPGDPDSATPSLTVTGKVLDKTPSAGNIDALLLQVTSFSGRTGISYIQRYPVSGGVAPAANLCTKAGDTLAVDYESDYAFFSQLKRPAASGLSNATSNSTKVVASYFGEGFQLYTYENSSWVLKGASASLSSVPGREIVGSHYFLYQADASGGQPTWTIYSPTYSRVTGKVTEKVSSDNSSVPVLRLERTSSSGEPEGIARATRIERLSPRGGLPPTNPGKNGERFRSPYTSIYWFYA
ncbi:hypothetical protein SELMODRAFT_426270 [Selaginella moellendorffii]|uniref:Uncharacterized protein n=1 Tax=Selaginella moellendorffii TaxID=88036 RepID=D8SVW4_SELML|nr:hypothetical protein SELMODRAFT_426270 [Selaginella moellendorffii]